MRTSESEVRILVEWMKAVSLLSCQEACAGESTGGRDDGKYLVAMRPGDTPVPIPNTMVKTRPADDTALETVWESRWLPD